MQTQTLTITTETMSTIGEDFTVTTFEQKQEVFCDVCGEQAYGSDAELRRKGWTFGGGAEFCGDCF
jgi:hypothetical protein